MKRYKLKKGIFIAIEGVDGVGKTTQVNRIKEHFSRKGYKVSTFKEPTNSEYGQAIREIAQNGRENTTPEEELELFVKDRELDCKFNIQPALDRNELVVLDRYFYSNIAYQGAIGVDVSKIRIANEKIAIVPDLVIILDCAVNIGLSRIRNFRGEIPNHFEGEDYLEEVREIFLEMVDKNIQIIDASRTEDEVFVHVKNIVNDIISPHNYIIDDQPDLFKMKFRNQNFDTYKN